MGASAVNVKERLEPSGVRVVGGVGAIRRPVKTDVGHVFGVLNRNFQMLQESHGFVITLKQSVSML